MKKKEPDKEARVVGSFVGGGAGAAVGAAIGGPLGAAIGAAGWSPRDAPRYRRGVQERALGEQVPLTMTANQWR